MIVDTTALWTNMAIDMETFMGTGNTGLRTKTKTKTKTAIKPENLYTKNRLTLEEEWIQNPKLHTSGCVCKPCSKLREKLLEAGAWRLVYYGRDQ